MGTKVGGGGEAGAAGETITGDWGVCPSATAGPGVATDGGGDGGVGVAALDGIDPIPSFGFVDTSSRIGGRSIGGSEGERTTDCERMLCGRTVSDGTRKVPLNAAGKCTCTFPAVERTRSLIGALGAPVGFGGYEQGKER